MKNTFKDMEDLIKDFERIVYANGGKLNDDDVNELRTTFDKLKGQIMTQCCLIGSYEKEILKLKEKKMIKFIFRNQEIELEEKDCGTSLNFNGCYLVEIDEDLKPTGRAINGYGQPITFNEDELIIIK